MKGLQVKPRLTHHENNGAKVRFFNEEKQEVLFIENDDIK